MIEREKVTLPAVVNYRTANGVRAAIVVAIGNKWTKVVIMDNPMVISKVYNRELNYMNETGYPMKRAGKLFRRAARTWYGNVTAIPKGVRAALRGL